MSQNETTPKATLEWIEGGVILLLFGQAAVIILLLALLNVKVQMSDARFDTTKLPWWNGIAAMASLPLFSFGMVALRRAWRLWWRWCIAPTLVIGALIVIVQLAWMANHG